jgi:hypothetical protein
MMQQQQQQQQQMALISHETRRCRTRAEASKQPRHDSELNYLRTLSKGRYIDNNQSIATVAKHHVDTDQTTTS